MRKLLVFLLLLLALCSVAAPAGADGQTMLSPIQRK